ncbi:hypothetical protein [Tamlana sp. I1]|uniref:hypothetical protein n=1 Tax=Tamlana sp. I1 TaxID=2762061 RepID=UPI00188DD238|nr:hypothetical protein [Tamlana sp. I1]
MRKIILGLALLFSVATVFTGCRDKKTAGEKIEEAVDDAGDAVEDAADDVGDAIDDLADEIEE